MPMTPKTTTPYLALFAAATIAYHTARIAPAASTAQTERNPTHLQESADTLIQLLTKKSDFALLAALVGSKLD